MAALELSPDYEFPDINDPEFKVRLGRYITYPKGGYFLRKFDLKNQSCYVSSVVYILIGMFSQLPLDEMVKRMERVLKFRNFQTPLLRNIVGSNTADISSIRISSFAEAERAFEHGIAFLGLVTPPDEYRPQGTIKHYFILKRNSILSSYGSSDVAMRQFQTKLDAGAFNEFAKDLADPAKDDDTKARIAAFMREYFLNPSYATIQRKEYDDMLETYGDNGEEGQYSNPDDLRWKKNQPDDIDREIAYYQGEPCYIMLFPNMLGAFEAEVVALELIDAMTKWEKSKKTEKDREEYEKKREDYERINEELLRKLEETRRMIEEAPEDPLTPLPLAKIDAMVELFTPKVTEELEDSLQSLSLESEVTPKKTNKGRPPVSPLVERIKKDAEVPDDTGEPVALTPAEGYEELNKFGIVSVSYTHLTLPTNREV